jgi:hypothetical protein
LVISGITDETKSERIVRSDDGKAALWLGVIDDLWKLGKPRGNGGPWHNTAVKVGEPSDPFLCTGYDHKRVTLSHSAKTPVKMRIEADITGTGQWCTYSTIEVPAGGEMTHRFPDSFGAYWLRVIADTDCSATVEFVYE